MRGWLVMGVCALLAVGAGCANERRSLLERSSAQAVYHLPPEQVMAAARAALHDRGYILAPSTHPNVLRTQWKVDGNLDLAGRWSRYLVMGYPLEDGRFVVRAHQVTHTTVGRTASHPGLGNGSRDAHGRGSGREGGLNYVPGEPYSPARPVFSRALDLEWEILERAEPRFAAALEQQVDRYLTRRSP